MAKLVLSADGTIINTRFIDKERITIGRGPDNDIPIGDGTVSAQHAEIVTVGEDQIVVDLDSLAGTFVNGQRVSRQILAHRDVIEFGRFSLRYLNSKTSGESDFERTTIIDAVPDLLRPADAAGQAAAPVAHAARAVSVRFPSGRLRRSGGQGPECIELDRVVAMLGVPGVQLAVVTRRPLGFFLTHVEGKSGASINRRPIDRDAQPLANGDVIEVAGQRYEFHLDSAATPAAA
jgi:pSer/pThr/pTyr-binding forkhead associated (FHA) protein